MGRMMRTISSVALTLGGLGSSRATSDASVQFGRTILQILFILSQIECGFVSTEF